jgi:hypothetical protein
MGDGGRARRRSRRWRSLRWGSFRRAARRARVQPLRSRTIPWPGDIPVCVRSVWRLRSLLSWFSVLFVLLRPVFALLQPDVLLTTTRTFGCRRASPSAACGLNSIVRRSHRCGAEQDTARPAVAGRADRGGPAEGKRPVDSRMGRFDALRCDARRSDLGHGRRRPSTILGGRRGARLRRLVYGDGLWPWTYDGWRCSVRSPRGRGVCASAPP